MNNPLISLAEEAARWRVRDLSSQVEWDARRAVLDWFGALIPGCLDGSVKALSNALAPHRGDPEAVSYADGILVSARHAALMNGVASHTAEFDDIFRDGGYHPGSPTISAALAIAQAQGSSYEEFLRAVISGYEVGCRIAIALQPSHYMNWHITGTVGTFGAAVSTAILMGCSADQIAHAIAIASSFAGGHQENLQGEGVVKALHSGHAAEAGVLAGLAARAGVTGSLNSLHARHGYAAATSDGTGNWEAALDGLGTWTPVSRMTFKNYGCCGHIFATLDGLKTLGAGHMFQAAEVCKIDVQGYNHTAAICDRMNVETARDARFSVQYCVAALMYLGNVRMGAFTPESLGREDIRALMARVTVREDPELSEEYPHRRMAKIKVRLTDGRVLEHFQRTRKGDPDDPLTDEELFEKFEELSSVSLNSSKIIQINDIIMKNNIIPREFPLLR